MAPPLFVYSLTYVSLTATCWQVCFSVNQPRGKQVLPSQRALRAIPVITASPQTLADLCIAAQLL